MDTARLTIRPIEENDWNSLKEIFSDFENSEYKNYDFPLPTEESLVKELTEKWVAEKKYFAVVLTKTGEMIGYICYHGTDIPDVGYALKRRFQRNGYAYEAVKAWIIQSQFDTFTAGVALGNRPSVALLEKLGFKLIKKGSMAFRKAQNGQEIVCDCGMFEYKK